MTNIHLKLLLCQGFVESRLVALKKMKKWIVQKDNNEKILLKNDQKNEMRNYFLFKSFSQFLITKESY